MPDPSTTALAAMPFDGSTSLSTADQTATSVPAERSGQYDYSHDHRAGLADLLNIRDFTPDQERGIAALDAERFVSFRGGNGTGKSFLLGACALVDCVTTYPIRAGFVSTKFDQSVRLAWSELKRCYNNARVELGGKMGVAEWNLDRDSWAKVLAFNEQDDGENVRGQMHCENQMLILEELPGVPMDILKALLTAMTSDVAKVWAAFNPVSKRDAGGRFESMVPPAGRVVFNALDAIEWQERSGKRIPGVASRAWLDDIAIPMYANTPLWKTNVLGQYQDESEEQMVIPRSWALACVNCIPHPSASDLMNPASGVDTGWGGSAETVFARRLGRVVLQLITLGHIRNVPESAARLSNHIRADNRFAAERIGVDCVGNGGSGVHDLLKEWGHPVVAVIGGSRPEGIPEIMSNLVTWCWWTVRKRIEATALEVLAARERKEAPDPSRLFISLPDDPRLIDQLTDREYFVKGDRRIYLETKEDMAARGVASPDRADGLAYSYAPELLSPLLANVPLLFNVPLVPRTDVGPRTAIEGRTRVERPDFKW